MNRDRWRYACGHSRSLEISVAVSIVALAVIVVGGAALVALKVAGRG